MAQLAQATESRITVTEKVIYTSKAQAAGAKGGLSMTQLRRSTTICCLFLGMLALAQNSWAQQRPPILEQIAKTYGVDSYGQVEAIR